MTKILGSIEMVREPSYHVVGDPGKTDFHVAPDQGPGLHLVGRMITDHVGKIQAWPKSDLSESIIGTGLSRDRDAVPVGVLVHCCPCANVHCWSAIPVQGGRGNFGDDWYVLPPDNPPRDAGSRRRLSGYSVVSRPCTMCCASSLAFCVARFTQRWARWRGQHGHVRRAGRCRRTGVYAPVRHGGHLGGRHGHGRHIWRPSGG